MDDLLVVRKDVGKKTGEELLDGHGEGWMAGTEVWGGVREVGRGKEAEFKG